MYEQFYGFREKPFQIVPNPAFLYKSPKHETALQSDDQNLRRAGNWLKAKLKGL